jgi:hypothetical protein
MGGIYHKATNLSGRGKKSEESGLGAPPKTSCGLELDKIHAVFVAKAPTITRWLSVYRLASGNFLCAPFPQQVSGGALRPVSFDWFAC